MSEEGVMEETHPYTVVVGVSATSKSPTALAWGQAQARKNDGRLVAVRVWRVPNPAPTTAAVSASKMPDMRDLEEEERKRLADDVAEVLGADHGAELHVVRGRKRAGLLSAAHGADLLVIDAPRVPSMSPLLAHRIVYAATCPVVVMPPTISGQTESAAVRYGRAVAHSALRGAGTAGRPGYRPPLLDDDD